MRSRTTKKKGEGPGPLPRGEMKDQNETRAETRKVLSPETLVIRL